MGWDRIRGHDAVRDNFLAAHARGRLGQAYLFAGPDGIGKRLFADELAKALLCERPPAALTACDACPSCAQVNAGSHPDVFRLRTPEGKHELPIDETRAFTARMALKSSRGAKKVGVVEDADDFNEESANAFLKTLEEPPPGSLLILLATGIDSQLPTILSRCQLVRFAPLGPADMAVVLAEHGVTDRIQAERLAEVSGGSVGRALALNDPGLWTFRQKLVDGVTAARPNFTGLAQAWQQFVDDAGKDTAAQRVRLSLGLRFLVESLRRALRLALGVVVDGVAGEEGDRLRAFAERAGPDRVVDLIERCLEADAHVERRVQVALVIESVLEPFARLGAPVRVGR